MQDITTTLAAWKNSLCREVDVGGLYARSKIAHKWKAPWRGLLLRESVAWRMQDLLEQSHALYTASQLLGARILLRSAFETAAVLIHLNQATRQVVAGTKDFHEFTERTEMLLLGSRDKSTPYETISILTVLSKADKRYPGLEQWYADLSEAAHPNFEGMLFGYSESDWQSRTTNFQNRWEALYGNSHLEAISACMVIFDAEYNHEWPDAFEALERWIEQNDAMLEATK
jgi:hypothetical protein